MPDVAMTTAAEPDGAPRIALLDILRGVAILGILFMNINDMGNSLYASLDDIRHLGWSASDRVAWWLRAVLADGTARCMLEMLFGAGMVILTDRAAEKAGGWVVMRRYYARNLILFAFGLVHVFILLWPGDILHTYGLAALVAFPFRRLRARELIAIGLMFAAFQLAGGAMGYGSIAYKDAAYVAVHAREQALQPLSGADRGVMQARADSEEEQATSAAITRANIAAEDEARTGTFITWAAMQWHVFIEQEMQGLEMQFVWEAASVMLIGAALFRLGILQGRRSRRFYVWMMLVAYAVGAPLRAAAAYEMTLFDDRPHILSMTYELSREAMTLGHVGAINLLVGTALGAKLLRPFVAAGRAALSIYVAQTLITLWVLYPPFVLGLYGKMTWGPLMVTAFLIDAALLAGATMWVRRFDIAPVEWAWRSLVERRRLSWRRRVRGVPASAGQPVFGPGPR